MHAEKALVKVDRDYIRFIRNMNIIKNSMDRATLLYDGGLKEGEEIGLQKGEEKKALEIARNALAEGATPEFVQKITGLDIETISGLL
jgi:predicted transposase YdaD